MTDKTTDLKGKPVHAPLRRSIRSDHDWLMKHSHKYPGCWISVYEGELIAADPDLHKVHEATREKIGDAGALIHYELSEEQRRSWIDYPY